MKPFMLALNFAEGNNTEAESRVAKGRGVAFAVASLSQGRSVFATCKHNFMNKSALVIFDENGETVGLDGEGMQILFSSREDLDVALIILPISVAAERIRLSTQSFSGKIDLSHAQNVVGSKNNQGCAFVVSSEVSRKSDERAICSLGSGLYEFVKTESEVSEALAVGRKTFYSVLHMGSRPGVSGSPLWDKYGAIRGMVCGGNDEAGPMPKLIFLPVRSIEAELKILIHNERVLKKR